jgi:glucose/arabinose dehydrogenase/chitodextrinase
MTEARHIHPSSCGRSLEHAPPRPPTQRPSWVVAALSSLALLLPLLASAQVFTDPAFSAQTVVTLPAYWVVGMTWSSDGRMFIWQKNGRVLIYKNGALNSTPFLDLVGRVNVYSDRGFLGLALDPDFQTNGYVYLSYVYEDGPDVWDPGPKISRLTRVTADPSNPDVALPGSEVILLDDVPADGGGHTLGSLLFAPDGTLFVSNGEGATAAFANAQALGAQNIDSMRGKILRINRDGSAPAPPQAINPFYDGTNSIRSKVWAYGLRNPFRFDRHPTLGNIYACDVGWNTYEEVNQLVPGENYGWPCYEGPNPQPAYQTLFPEVCETLTPFDVMPPLYSYNHTQGSAVVGCAFYSGSAYPPEFQNNFFFSDYSGGWMRRLVLDSSGGIVQNEVFATSIGSPVATAVGPDGLLYYVDFVTGQIRRIVRNGPVAAASATPRSGYSPLHVNFSSAGSTGNSLTYSWDFGDGSSSTAPNPTHNYVSGQVQTYAAKLTVKDAANATSTAQVSVTVGSLPPNPTILAPTNGVGAEPGETVSFQGTASDPDETLPASALNWTLLLHHNTHVHTSAGGTGSSGSFVVEYHGVGSYSYELVLTATDSSGLATSTSVQVPVLTDTQPPTNPSNLAAASSGSNSIDLSWTGSTDNAAIAYYAIERCTGASCNDFVQTGVSPNTSFVDGGLSPATHYTYRVRTFDPSGNPSGYSNAASAQTAPGGAGLPGLVAAYSFDEGTGGTVTDYSASGNTGDLLGATWTPAGRFGGALSFASGAVVQVNHSASLGLTTGMTLEAWVYPTSALTYWKPILQKETQDFFLSASTGGDRIGMGGFFGGVWWTVLEGPTGLPVNQWTHVAGTYDGSTLHLYVNGVLVASQAQTGALQQSGLPLHIGGDTYSGEFFTGRIDEVRIYNRALSPSEIQNDMTTPVHVAAVPAVNPALVALALGLSGSIALARRSAAARQRRACVEASFAATSSATRR